MASRVKSSKTHILFHISEGSCGLDTALLSQDDVLLREQVFSGLSAVFPELESDLDTAVSLGFGTLGFKRAGRAVVTLVVAALREVTVVGAIRAGLAVSQGSVGWIGESILVRVVGEILGTEPG
jgi:hypothetical protein